MNFASHIDEGLGRYLESECRVVTELQECVEHSYKHPMSNPSVWVGTHILPAEENTDFPLILVNTRCHLLDLRQYSFQTDASVPVSSWQLCGNISDR